MELEVGHCGIYLSVDRSRKPPRGHRHFGGALGELALRERSADRLGQRDRHPSPRLRLSYIPLAYPIAVCSLCQVDVNVRHDRRLILAQAPY